MPFKFRLAKILSLRKDDLDEAQRALAAAFKRLEDAKVARNQTEAALKKAQIEMIEDNYKMAEGYMRVINKKEKELKEREIEIQEAKQGIVEARAALIKAQQKVEALETLKEKQREEYIQEENRLEQIQTDEKVSLKFARDLLEKAESEQEY